MIEFLFIVASAFWLGILTSISPCPLATNIAAISFVSKRVLHPRKILLTGFLYIAGRTLTYLVIGIILVSSILSAPYVSHILQKYMNMFLGPILILVGMILLELFQVNFNSAGISEKMQKRIDSQGVLGAFFLGVLFALSFCPISAALFFGSLLPMAVQYESNIIIPLAYGIATGLPVLVFAILISISTKRVSAAYKKIVSFEKWARQSTGVLFILIGIYYCLVHIYCIDIFNMA